MSEVLFFKLLVILFAVLWAYLLGVRYGYEEAKKLKGEEK